MPADFVPFIPAASSVPRQAVAGSFAPMNLKGPHDSPANACTPGGQLKVELKRDGERITQIRLQCRCGDLIEIDCEY
jgi:hypothetical protein